MTARLPAAPDSDWLASSVAGARSVLAEYAAGACDRCNWPRTCRQMGCYWPRAALLPGAVSVEPCAFCDDSFEREADGHCPCTKRAVEDDGQSWWDYPIARRRSPR